MEYTNLYVAINMHRSVMFLVLEKSNHKHLGTKDFEKGYYPIVKLVKNDSSDLFADSHKFINMCNYA